MAVGRAKIGDLVCVAWRDAKSHDPWETEAELETAPELCISYGVLIRNETKKENPHILIVGDYFEADDTVGRSIAIPAGMIEDITVIKKKVRSGD